MGKEPESLYNCSTEYSLHAYCIAKWVERNEGESQHSTQSLNPWHDIDEDKALFYFDTLVL